MVGRYERGVFREDGPGAGAGGGDGKPILLTCPAGPFETLDFFFASQPPMLQQRHFHDIIQTDAGHKADTTNRHDPETHEEIAPSDVAPGVCKELDKVEVDERHQSQEVDEDCRELDYENCGKQIHDWARTIRSLMLRVRNFKFWSLGHCD